MTYPGTTSEIRFGDAVQITDPNHEKKYKIGRISAQVARNESEFFVKFGNGDECAISAYRFQRVGSPRTR